MQSDKERIELILKTKKLNNIEFCNKTATSPSTLSHILSERTKPTLLILRNIVEAFPDLNPMWVLLGQGEMFTSDITSSPEPTTNNFANYTDDLFATLQDGTSNKVITSNAQKKTVIQAQDAVKQQVSSEPVKEINIEEVVTATLAHMQKPQRKVTEVRIFFDDGTFECFFNKE